MYLKNTTCLLKQVGTEKLHETKESVQCVNYTDIEDEYHFILICPIT